jgi:hypothetical protein
MNLFGLSRLPRFRRCFNQRNIDQMLMASMILVMSPATPPRSRGPIEKCYDYAQGKQECDPPSSAGYASNAGVSF